MIDYDGRILAQAAPGPGEKVVVGPIDLAALRAERERRMGWGCDWGQSAVSR